MYFESKRLNKSFIKFNIVEYVLFIVGCKFPHGDPPLMVTLIPPGLIT